MRLVYRYKLSKKNKENERFINRVRVSKNWIEFDSRQDLLDRHVKTKLQDGILDFQIIDYKTRKVKFDSVENNKVKNFNYYDRKTLATFNRSLLEDIALAIDLNPVKKRDEFLVDCIIKKQDEIKKLFEESEQKEE